MPRYEGKFRLTLNSFKFVVDGIWTTDKRVREENDGDDNINNILLPEEIKDSASTQPTTNATMSGVTPDSTTAALAAAVPKESNGNLPGTFPETPGQESEQILSVNPIPASGGYGNPIKLNPGEKVPDPSTIHGNTVDSTVRLDKESYEKGDSVPLGSTGTQNDTAGSSAFTVPPVTSNLIPESSLPIGGPAQRAASTEQDLSRAGGPAQQAAMADPGVTIQSAAPTSTTAALAAEVPLEKNKQTNGTEPVQEVPQVVKESIAEAHKDPEAAANKEAVAEKRDVENELHTKVPVEESAGAPAPTATAATTSTAPDQGQGLVVPPMDSADVSPTSTPPPGRASAVPAPTSAPATEDRTVPATTAKPAESSNNDAAKSSTGGSSKDEKKKKRLSGFFSKLKEKLK